ncbi:metallo-hydrolase/oxidoreductase [Methylobacterium indicum]|uniref:metallo-hydrolase/oxidoreductase n=1 Tax=Methylobacterium indicum TaxID=1775910 RepID=UPI001FD416FC|nr:metallo-hydrolase/oxidoreductase [Methylobacterium indicum]
MSDRPYGRVSFEFDAIDADITDAVGPQIRELFQEDETKPFALLRIMTTTARFLEVAGVIPNPGDWFFLEIEPRGRRPGLMTWHAQLGPAGYTSHSRGLTVRASRLPSEDDGPRRPRSLGAAVAPRATLPQHIDQISRLPSAAASSAAVRAVLAGVAPPAAVVVRDVGQASFASLVDIQGKALIHFDVGFPISFNRHTSPRNFASDPTERPLVVLSHWDWDHLHAAFALPHLRDCGWIVPRQRIGPGAARLAAILAAKGNLLVWQTGSIVAFPGGSLMDCAAPGGSQNDTGLALHIRLASGNTALLTGDADYQCLPPGCVALGPVTHLIATHHGARFKSLAPQVPVPTMPGCTMVVSYGTRNVYRHPHIEALRVHATAGWKNWVSTAGRRGFGARGDRWLR